MSSTQPSTTLTPSSEKHLPKASESGGWASSVSGVNTQTLLPSASNSSCGDALKVNEDVFSQSVDIGTDVPSSQDGAVLRSLVLDALHAPAVQSRTLVPPTAPRPSHHTSGPEASSAPIVHTGSLLGLVGQRPAAFATFPSLPDSFAHDHGSDPLTRHPRAGREFQATPGRNATPFLDVATGAAPMRPAEPSLPSAVRQTDRHEDLMSPPLPTGQSAPPILFAGSAPVVDGRFHRDIDAPGASVSPQLQLQQHLRCLAASLDPTVAQAVLRVLKNAVDDPHSQAAALSSTLAAPVSAQPREPDVIPQGIPEDSRRDEEGFMTGVVGTIAPRSSRCDDGSRKAPDAHDVSSPPPAFGVASDGHVNPLTMSPPSDMMQLLSLLAESGVFRPASGMTNSSGSIPVASTGGPSADAAAFGEGATRPMQDDPPPLWHPSRPSPPTPSSPEPTLIAQLPASVHALLMLDPDSVPADAIEAVCMDLLALNHNPAVYDGFSLTSMPACCWRLQRRTCRKAAERGVHTVRNVVSGVPYDAHGVACVRSGICMWGRCCAVPSHRARSLCHVLGGGDFSRGRRLLWRLSPDSLRRVGIRPKASGAPPLCDYG
eukprot:TRINITY_DN8017_c0_g1_i1.p1 TRINITY_DN8017_c0_g1~~TRINITY_DN8017_c0_g1_i1.p1  ORF type:complete len:601 (+),score=30.85 TRINITY_DN8017_c0_g1_i1:301-2103(+)